MKLLKKHILVTIFTAIFFALPAFGDDITKEMWHLLSKEEVSTIKKIAIAIDNKKYDRAFKFANRLKKDTPAHKNYYEALKTIILWNKYKEINPLKTSFSDISRFVLDHPYFPEIKDLRRNVERVAIMKKVPFSANQGYFDFNNSNYSDTKIYLLESKINYLSYSNPSETDIGYLQKEIRQNISDIWVNQNLSAKEEGEFLEKYQDQLSEIDHINRIDRLLWDGKITAARRIMSFVDEDYQKLFRATIKLKSFPRYMNNIILTVPRKLRGNEGLAYRKVLWYRSKEKTDELIDTMLSVSKNSKFPQKWWSLRRLYARELLKTKDYKDSYKLISNHSLPTTHSNYWEAEWTSGWIALRFLDRPRTAYKHFENLYNNVVQPVTIARASYWLGMSAEAMNDKTKAIEWYKTAAKYPLYFYGQLAIHKHRNLDPLGSKSNIILPKDPIVTKKDMVATSKSESAKIAYLLSLMNDKKSAAEIFKWAIWESKTKGEVAAIMKIINKIGDRHLDAKISRSAAKKNVFFIKDKFQIIEEVKDNEYAPLVHAIIKQESGFAPSALSSAGAIGFMQLMPGTAKLVAKDLGIKYSKHKLSRNIKYNIKLGSFYIKKLIDRFDGSEMLAIAAYNAGPNNARRWINEFYDPREEKDIDKVVDWIELITYSETRNYVQRITENLIVYKYLMSRSNYDQIK